VAASPEKSPAPIGGPLRTLAQVAKRLGVSPTTVTEYVDAGELAAADMSARPKPGKRRKRILRFRDEDVDRFEERRFRAANEAIARQNAEN
jgi:AcrR family transcriptional regulator